jgi:hypothetical protein
LSPCQFLIVAFGAEVLFPEFAAMIKQEIELVRLLTETHRLRQQINR